MSTPAIRAAVILLCLLAGFCPAPASAQGNRCEAPPGTSAIEQYCEALPGATGDGGPSSRTIARGSVDARTTAALERSGKDGQGVLALPAVKARPAESPKRGGAEDRSSIEAVGGALSPGGGSGFGFVWLLVLVAAVLGALAWTRSRRSAGPDR